MNQSAPSVGNLSLKQLRAFVTVAECGSFTGAAGRLALSQSAVSLLLRDLEAELGLKLLDRTTRSVRPTDAGANLLPVAARVLQDLGHAVADSRDLAARRRGRVRFACSPLQASLLMPKAIAAFLQRFPDIQIILRDTPGGEIVDLVESGEVDLALGVLPPEHPSTIEESPLMTDSVVLLLPIGHPLAARRRVRWADLSTHRFIALGPHNSTRVLIDHHAAQAGVRLNIVNEVSFAWTAIGMVEAGLGISIIPAYARFLGRQHPGVEMRPFEERSVRRAVSLLRRADRSLSPAAQSFADFLFDHFKPRSARSVSAAAARACPPPAARP